MHTADSLVTARGRRMPNRKLASVVLLPVLLFFASGCYTTYLPRTSPRVQLTMHHGSVVYVRNGHAYPSGLLGGGLEDAVKGNAKAEAQARAFRHGRIWSVLGYFLGTAALTGGLIVTGNATPGPNDQQARQQDLGFGIALGGLAIELAAITLQSAAQTHQYDAINLFNDGIVKPPPVKTTKPAPVKSPPPAKVTKPVPAKTPPPAKTTKPVSAKTRPPAKTTTPPKKSTPPVKATKSSPKKSSPPAKAKKSPPTQSPSPATP